MEKHATNRILAMLLVMLLVFTQMPFTALAESGVTEKESGCTHQHDESCAYTEGAECTHVCGDGTCDYADAVPCDHECDEGCEHSCGDGSCAYDAGAACNHICDEAVCGYIAATPYTHEHDEDCGGLTTPTDAVTVLGFSTPAVTATVPLGASYDDLPLPETVETTLTDAATPIDISVEWTDDDGYDGDVPGDYAFTAVPLGYSLADGVSAPVFTVTVSDTAEPTQIIVARFDELDEGIQWQGYDPGEIASADELNLPAVLTGTDAEDEALTISDVTWSCTAIVSEPDADPIAFDPDVSNIYEFTAALPEGYAPAEGVALPVITVFIRGGIMTMSAGSDLTITGGTSYTYLPDSATGTYVLTITAGGTYNISMATAGATTTTDRIVVKSGLTNVNITLNGVSIDMSGKDYVCAFDMTGATVNLTLTGDNSLESGLGRAGLEVPPSSTLTVMSGSPGSLTAVGGGQGAGIGSGAYISSYNFGTVNIEGGTVNAQGGALGAGIGTGQMRSAGDGVVNISGGKITATGGGSSAGIGGAVYSEGCTVNISGGTVVANGSVSAGGIGAGGSAPSGFNGNLTITGGSVLRTSQTSGGSAYEAATTNGSNPVYRVRLSGLPVNTLFTGISGIGGYGLNDVYTDGNGFLYFWLPVGSYSVEAVTSGSKHYGAFTQAANNDNYWSLTAFVPVTGISGIPGEMIAGTLALNGVVAPASATNKTIAWSLVSAGTTGANLSGSTLTTNNQGTVTVRATITGGSLNGDYTQIFSIDIVADNLTVTGGDVNTDWVYDNGNVIIKTDTRMTISGATTTKYVKVNSGVTANLTIHDLYIDVSEQAENTAAFDMTGATVNLTLTGTNTLKSAGSAAGLQAPSGSTLVISSDSTGSLTATGGEYGAGIGGGNNYSGGAITISGGTVTASGGNSAAGIGGGNSRAGGVTNITGGTVTARGGSNGAGIGGGYGSGGEGGGGTINISGGTVIASGGSNGAGIGGGYRASDKGTLTVTGGSIKHSGASTPEAARTNGQETIYLVTLTVGESPVANTSVTAGSIGGVDCTTGTPTGNEYGIKDVVTDSAGKLYFWLPERENIPVTATAGGSLYMNTVSPATNNNAAATLVIPAITITDQPQDATVTAGSISGALSVTASSTPGTTLSYQWYLGTGATNVGGTQIFDATGSSFAIPTDLTKGDYFYFCEITINETGTTLRSDVATVTVQNPPAAAPDVSPEPVSRTADSVTVKKPDDVSGDVQFACKTGDDAPEETDWQESGEFTGLNPNTDYTFYMRLAATDTHEASPASPSQGVTTQMASLTGVPAIDNMNPKFGDTLTAGNGTLAAFPAGNMGALSYEWNRDGATIDGATDSTYTVQAADIGKTITVTVTAENCYGSKTSAATSAVGKGIPSFTAPTGLTATYGDILVDVSLPAGFTWESASDTLVGAVGTQNHTVSYNPDSSVYETVPGISVDIEVTPKNVTITNVTAENKTYDGTTNATISGTAEVSGKVGNDDVIVVAGSAAFSDANAGTGKTVTFSGYSLDGTAAGNYTLSAQPASVTANITPKSITITPDSSQSKIYGANNPALAYTLSQPLINGDDFTGSLSRAEGENAGSYAINLGTLSAGGNYTLTLAYGTVNFTITQATAQSISTNVSDVTITAYTARAATDSDGVITLANLPAEVTVITNGGTTTLPIVWTTATPYNAKGAIYNVTGTLTGNSNVAVSGTTDSVTVMVTVTAVTAPVPAFSDTLAIIDTSKPSASTSDLGAGVLPTSGNITVEGTSVAYTVNWNGGETIDLTSVGNTETFTGVASYPGAPAWLTLPGNTSVSRKVAVTDKTPVTITASSIISKTYTGAEYTHGDVTISDIQITASDLVWAWVSTDGGGYNETTPPTDAGDYKVTISVRGNHATCYGRVDYTFTINKAALTITADDKAVKAGETLPAVTIHYNGFVGNDNETNAFSTDPVAAHSVTDTNTPGSFAIDFSTQAVLVKDNYNVTHTPGTLTVSPKSSACDVLGVTSPSGATINGNAITATVGNGTTGVTVNVTVSADAAWALYSDSACANQITGAWTLAIGVNTAYIKVTAEDGTEQLYTITVTQSAISTYTISVSANPSNGGTVSGGGSVTSGGSHTVTATANSNYRFTNWTESGAVVSTSASYIFTVSGDRSLVANFSYTGGGNGGGGSTTTTTTTTPSTAWLEQNLARTLARTANGNNQDYARTKSTGAYGIRKAAFAALAGLHFEHDTVADGAVQMRLYINDPANIKNDLMVSGYVKGSDVDYAKNTFEKYFNNKVRAIHMDQTGSFGVTVQIAARVDLTGMDTKKLCFSAYDKNTNTYRRIEKPTHWIDKNGYLRFTTEYAGEIIISEGPLKRKS